MILGVCGKAASGKSEVTKFLGTHGFREIYTDQLVHDMYKAGEVGAVEIAKKFGSEYLKADGSVDRDKLRALVFSDPHCRAELEYLIHPLVRTRVSLDLRGHSVTGDVAIESVFFRRDGLFGLVDKILLIERDEKEIESVLLEQRGFTKVEVAAILSTFESPTRVDYYIQNGGSLEDLKGLVRETLNL